MSVIYVLLTISIVVAVIFFVAFIHSVRSGQYEDSYTPSVRILFEDELIRPKKNTSDQSVPISSKTSTKSKQI
ncbi:cbb3-type cytochrome oxidase assembly protein CcoS [Muriicola sp. SD30]|uniref:cbb3-type cytochrome oxidase assembly protein CcoS n=1 Tax=Muriicola sp. SD30 TaxID=3240936 RepID=UPI001801B27C|nr:cbb3-type cytochrome oxidase assembly protein CcoS [Muriicola sp.]MBT8290880.1 cbb3-type cytochrome oxidase assembly protein CcoS [Muriicola sp.]NNK36079.1 cbb3-type cytochrome oxidase assembly protein CcoS [Eudoraea sp.]NNL38710.1 cbb3-type cytochrome oxidase assembly protein CcoS [Flavobacteriaceae bacterium]